MLRLLSGKVATYLNGLRLIFLPKHSRKILTYLNQQNFSWKSVMIVCCDRDRQLLAFRYKNRSSSCWFAADCQSFNHFFSWMLQDLNWWAVKDALQICSFVCAADRRKTFNWTLFVNSPSSDPTIRSVRLKASSQLRRNDLLDNFNLSFVSYLVWLSKTTLQKVTIYPLIDAGRIAWWMSWDVEILSLRFSWFNLLVECSKRASWCRLD